MSKRSLILLIAGLLLSAQEVHAADFAAANETIWPSQNDVAQTAGDGKKLLENQWAKPTAVYAVNNYSLTGLTVPGSSANLNINVALGTAYIAGRHITIPGATTVTATASATNFVFLKLTRDGAQLVTGASFEVNTTGTPPTDSTPIATLTAGASSISATADLRILPTTITVLTSGTSWTVPAGITTIYVQVFGASGGGGGGGQSYDGSVGGNGGAGGAGGTTSFDTISTTGGAAGGPGLGAGQNAAGAAGAAQGVGSGASINRTGSGASGGRGGGGSQFTGANAPGLRGGTGGDGGYAAGNKSVTPGSSITYAIGAAGTSGAGGTGNSGPNGGAGVAGSAGMIVITY